MNEKEISQEEYPQCSCHASICRAYSFECSAPNDILPCWCGLIKSYDSRVQDPNEQSCQICETFPNIISQNASQNENIQKQEIHDGKTQYYYRSQYKAPRLSVYLNVKFWKVSVDLVQKSEPQLQDYLKYWKLKQNVYFVSNYLVGPVIGRGSRARVRRGLMKTPENIWRPVALKFYFRCSCSRQIVPVFDQSGFKDVISGWTRVQFEWLLQGSVEHPNITKLIELVWNPMFDVWILVLESGFMPLAKFDFSKNAYSQRFATENPNVISTLSEKTARTVIYQTLLAVDFLHHNRIVHKDIKPENILFNRYISKDCIQLISTRSSDMPLVESNCPMKLESEYDDWDNMSGSTEEFLWEGDFSGIVSENDFHLEMDSHVYRYQRPALCFCCAMGLTHPSEENIEAAAVDTQSLQTHHSNINACMCCSLLLNHPLSRFENDKSDTLIRLIDFGLAVQVKDPECYIYDADGTRHFTPPECFPPLEQESTSTKCAFPRDMWSIGCLLYCLLMGKLPFDGESSIELIYHIVEGFRAPLPQWISPEAKDFILRTLESNPEKRLTVKESLNHSWFTLNKKNSILKKEEK